MKIIVGSSIRVENPSEQVKAYCSERLSLDNPDYYKKVRLGKWTGNTPQNIILYAREGFDVVLPFGCLRDLWGLYPKKDDWKIDIRPIEPRKYRSDINPYDYQEKAINEALKARNGVLVMPCGSGKTQCGLEIISRIGGRALWLTHTQDLLNQSMTRAKSTLDLCGGTFGTITAGKVNIGTHITFATVQTMCKLNLEEYRSSFDIIIVDEAQHCSGTPTRVTQFYKVVTSLSARYKYGLTATPKRADGLEKAMFAILGGVIHEVTKKEVEKNTCPIKVEKIETGYIPDYDAVLMGDGTIDYSKIIDDMIHNEDRFKVVVDKICSLPKGSKAIILANRVEYLMKLKEECWRKNEIKSVCLSGITANKLSKGVRKKSLEMLDKGEISCIFATYQLAKEGLDVPSLNYVVFATPEKDETTVIQSAGRVGRKAEGKKYGTVVDFIDDFGMYKGWSKKRDRCYKKIDAVY